MSAAHNAQQQSPSLADAQALAALGFRPIWLSPPTGPEDHAGKRPLDTGWQNSPWVTPDKIPPPPRRGCNLGIVTGDVKDAPRAWIVVDCDNDTAVEWARVHLPNTGVRTVTAKGLHLFYKHPRDGKIRNGAKLGGMALDVRGDGGQVVGPPSIHKTGHVYRQDVLWTGELLDSAPVFDRTWLAQEAANDDREASPSSTAFIQGERNAALTKLAGAMRRKNMSEAAILAALQIENKEKCRPPLPDIDIHRIAGSISRYHAQELTEGWDAQLRYNKEGALVPGSGNLEIIMRNDPEWAGKIAWDDMRSYKFWAGSPPWLTAGQRVGTRFQDADAINACHWFERSEKYRLAPHKEEVFDAAEVVARKNPKHEVRDYLDSLVWDGVTRSDLWLCDLLGAERTAYNRMVQCMWLISAVARVYAPGCQADNALIIEGDQGIGKSSIFKIIFRPEWVLEAKAAFGSRDFLMEMHSHWIIVLDEMAGFSKHESDEAKQFLTIHRDTFRPPYGREPVTLPRQCVFAGTTNRDQYLRDATGNRRYWPVRCTKKLDRAAAEAVRDQLLAEAVALYKAGTRWHPETDEEIAGAVEAQAERYSEHVWVEVVRGWEWPTAGISTAEALTKIGIEPAKQDRRAQMDMGEALRSAGGVRVREASGARRWLYVLSKPNPS